MDKELQAKEVLSAAAEETIAYSANTGAPIDDIVYDSHIEEGQCIHIYVLFAEIEQLKAMEEENRKDEFMSVFIKYLTSHAFPFGENPKLSFEFSIQM
ncbi:hypothetical protein SAMN02910358_01530 [Lachnospiraceae bacterium XBB1006]|nr:hypothetical protein SAMN02910358_01530 [Lachnospiraceae bacterium XBB1006]